MKLVFDIETDNLLPKLTTFHCAGAIDVETGKEYWFRPHQSKDFLDLLDQAEVIVAHNAFGFDVPALTKLFGWKPKATVHCTKVMSQLLKYNRFGFGHSLKQWGVFLKDNKGDYTGGFEKFNEDMFQYMQQDVKLLAKVYKYLLKETKNYMTFTKSKKVLTALRSEMTMDAIMVEQCGNGWKFDKQGAVELRETIDKKMQEIATFINPKLGAKANVVDPDTVKEHEKTTGKRYAIPKKPIFTKAGRLSKTTIDWFGLPLDTDVTTCPILGEYCRITFSLGDIGNTDTVKTYLGTLGWQPDEWNWKRINGNFVKVSAKLSDSSLEGLGDVGKALMEYYTLRSRKSILEGWFNYIDDNNRLHGDVFNIGTPTFRQTHKIIANLPGGNAVLGPEFRSLFVTEDGYKLVSADSAACQLRLLAHYMKDSKFTETVLNGDIHQMNADIIDCERGQAKRFIFAYLYGAGASKLSGYIGKTVDQTKVAMAKYKKALPALARLVDTVNKSTETLGFIAGLDDRPIYLDSSERHKSLNYLIQGAEAVVMKYTVNMIHEELAKAKIDSRIVLFYHDEVTYEVKEEQAEEAKTIIMRCFEEAPKELGVDIMTCGDCKIGNDYYEVH